jgi:hypothetical protein
MPPRRTRQSPPHNLSWFSAYRCWATLIPTLTPSSRNCRRLEMFQHHIPTHDIPYLGASHQVFIIGPHSRQYFRTSLRSLLTLDYVPRKVKIPVRQLPHDCFFCQEVTQHIFQCCRPFEYIATTPRSRGRPRQNTVPPPSSSKESDSESDSDNSEPPIDDNSTTTETLTHNGSPPPHYHQNLPPPPPSQNHAPPTHDQQQ